MRSSHEKFDKLTVDETTAFATRAGEDSDGLSFQVQTKRGQSQTATATVRIARGTKKGRSAISESLAFESESGHSSSSGNGQYYRSVAQIGIQIAGALEYAHNRGVIHRDVKPANLLLDRDGNAWLADFGLVKTEEDGLTRTGDVVGTLRYMSPERFQGICDNRADIYSLGITLYEMLTLEPAFAAINRPALIDSIRFQQPRRLRSIEKRIPADLETIIFKAIASDPNHRYGTAQGLAEDLENFIEQRPINARRVGALERLSLWAKKRKALAASLGTVACLLLVGLIGSVTAANHFFLKEREQAVLTTENAALAEKRTQERDRATSLAYLADLQIGADQLRAGRFDELFQVLKRYVPAQDQPDFRQWEWYFLLGELFRADRTILLPDIGNGEIHWTANGKRLGVASKNLEIMDSRSGQKLHSMEVNELSDFAFSADGLRVATVGHDAVKIWSVEDGTLLATLGLEASYFSCVNWFDDDRQLVIGIPARGENVVFVNVDTGEVTDRITTSGVAYNLHVSPDQKQLLVGLLTSCCVYDMETHALIREHGARTNEVAWSADGKYYAFLSVFQESSSNRVNVYRTSDGKMVREIQNSDPIESFGWGVDSRTILLGTTNQQVIVQDVETLKVLETLSGHHHSVNACQWNLAGENMFASHSMGIVKIWSLPKADQVRPVRSTLSSDGRYVATKMIDRVVVTEASTGKEVLNLPVEKGPVLSADWVPGHSCLVVRDQRLLRSYSVATGKTLGEIPMNYDVVESTKDHRYWGIGSKANSLAAFGDNDDEMMIWDATTGKLLRVWIPHSIAVRTANFSPDGTKLATVGNTDTRVWDIASGKELFVVHKTSPRGSGGFRLIQPQWSSDSKTLVTHDFDFSVKVCDGNDGALLNTLRGHANYLSDVAIAANDSRIVTIDNDHHAILWDASSGQKLIELPTRDFAGTQLSWDEETQSILIRSDDGLSMRFSAIRGKKVAESNSFVADFERLQQQLANSKDNRSYEVDAYNLPNRLLRNPMDPTAQAERALEIIEHSSDRINTSDKIRGMKVIGLVRTSKWQEAIDEARKLLKDSPGMENLIGLFYAIALWENDEKQKALDRYLAVDLYDESNHQQGISSVFGVREQAEKLFGAEQLDYYRSRLSAAPDDVAWLVRVGLLESRLDRLDQSILHLEKAVRNDSFNGFAMRQLVRGLGSRAAKNAREGAREAADADWKRAIKICEDDLRMVTPDRVPRAAPIVANLLAEIKFARLRRWNVRVATRTLASKGAELRLLDDKSYLAAGPNVRKEVYEFHFPMVATDSKLDSPRSLLLEILPHPSMPAAWSARTWDGRGAISQIEVLRVDASGKRTPVTIVDSFSPAEYLDPNANYRHRIHDALDQDSNTFWMDGSPWSPVPISLSLDKYPSEQTESLIVRLSFPEQGIGRVRFSFSDEGNAVSLDRVAHLTEDFRSDPWMNLVLAHLLSQETDAARERQRLLRDPNTGRSKNRDYLLRSWVLFQLGETAELLKSFEPFKEKNLSGLAGIYPSLLVDILSELDVSSLPPEEAAGLISLRAHCLRLTGRTADAIASYKEAIDLNPTKRLFTDLADLLVESGDREAALWFVDEAILLTPVDTELLLLKGVLLLELERREEYSTWVDGLPEFEEIASSDPLQLVVRLLGLPDAGEPPAAQLPPDPVSNIDANTAERFWGQIARALLNIHQKEYQAAINVLGSLTEIDAPNERQRPKVVLALAIQIVALARLERSDQLQESRLRYHFFCARN